MNTSENMGSVEQTTIVPLATIVERNQVWSRMAAKHGVVNPVPPWKTSTGPPPLNPEFVLSRPTKS